MAIVTIRGQKGGSSGLPEFTYTGNCVLIDDGKRNWRIKFLTSGTLRFTKLSGSLDVCLVGGGAGGLTAGKAAGGGGRTLTQAAIVVQTDTDYVITVGAGGAAGVDGGDSEAFNLSAAGGSKGTSAKGGDGGSGGGYAATSSNNPVDGRGGSDGADALHASTPGIGQHATTREFGGVTNYLLADVTDSLVLTLRDTVTAEQDAYLSEGGATVTVNDTVIPVADYDRAGGSITLNAAVTALANAAVRIGTLYAGGGGAYCVGSYNNKTKAYGGYGGGGSYMTADGVLGNGFGEPNTGGGGACYINLSTNAKASYPGGCGIVIIRNHREAIA